MLWFIITLVLVILFLAYLFPLIEVCGDSMNPTFNDGDIILGCRVFSLKENSIYIFTPPVEGHKYVIKRLTAIKSKHIKSKNRLYFEGDNPDCSYDSRMYGYVSSKKVVAKYIFTIRKRKECSENGCS